MNELNYTNLVKEILDFRNERKWNKFHTIQNLSAALNIEASEIQELLLWKNNDEVKSDLNNPDFRKELSGEIADVYMYLHFLCDAAGINALSAVKEKLEINKKRFPISDFNGTFSRENRKEIKKC